MSKTITVKFYEEAKTEGRAEGITQGITQGRAEGITQGITQGRAEGITEGITKGIGIGETNGIAKSVIRLLSRQFSEPSERLKTKIMKIRNEDQLYELLDFTQTCVSIGEFETALN